MDVDDIINECACQHLEKLNISHRGLVILPPTLSKLVKLKKLFLNDNCLLFPPIEILHLDQLEELVLDGNQLTMLPSDIGSLRNLTILGLNHNPISVLPDAIDMSNLQIMSMKFNDVTSLEDDIIIGFSKLTKLDLRETLLEDRPPHWKGLDFILLGKLNVTEETDISESR
ncbi:leucine-rich repeat protein SHOC-2 isoform X2 [Osmerus eperlanus]|uniref:leucine-rich repeat protein SHOC-2 isoform X2 n=1 Tax=Osmerus eperlanus TaxID=29151 RepID=UPI002E0FA76B